jgi:lipoate-protein ligase A
MDKEWTDIAIPTSLFKQIEEKIKDSDVATAQDYVIKILKENLPKPEESAESLSKEEEDKVKERLKALGYMD